MSAAGQRVYRSLAHVERDGADLLDGVHDQEYAAVAAQPGEGVEIATKSVVPLHGAYGDDASVARDRCFHIFDQQLSFTIGEDVDGNADLVALLEPGQRDFQELQVGDDDAVAALQWDRARHQVEPVRGAFDQRDVFLVGVDQLGNLRARGAAHRVHVDVMLRGRARGTERSDIEELAQLVDRALRREADAGRVEEDLLFERGEFLASILNVHRPNRSVIVQGGDEPTLASTPGCEHRLRVRPVTSSRDVNVGHPR